jgi:glutamate dehydrogenase (NAD(P)+)
MIFKYPDTAKIENHELYYLPVDILVFCGRLFIAETLAIEKIKAKIICLGVNAPLTERFEEALFEKGQICLPDFVSNSGGVLGSLMRHYMSDNKIKEIFKSDYSKKVRRLLSRSQETRTLPGKVARIMVEERIKYMKQESRKIGLSRFLKPLVPEFFKRPFAKRYFTKMMDS